MTLPTSVPTTTTISNHNNNEDDSDIFGPPRSSSSITTVTTVSFSSSSGSGSGSVSSISSSSSPGYYHHRSRVPMISPKLRLREERKRILQLCAHKLERIKDSETNLRRSVCINNTYSRLTDELRREKQNRCHLAAATVNNLSKYNADDSKMSRENIFSNTTEQNVELCNDYFYHNRINLNNLSSYEQQQQQQQQQYNLINTNFSCSPNNNNNKPNNKCSISTLETAPQSPLTSLTEELLTKQTTCDNIFQNSLSEQSNHQNNISNNNKTINSSTSSYLSTTMTFSSTSSSSSSCSKSSSSVFLSTSSCMSSDNSKLSSITNNNNVAATVMSSNSSSSSSCNSNNNNNTISSNNNNCNIVDTDDLDILDRELSAINASMPLIDPEITQGAEQLEKAISSRKRRSHSIDDENDRLVREALSQFYLPTQRLISEIDDCPFDIKRTKLSSSNNLATHIHHHHHLNNYNNNNIINNSSCCNNTNLMTSTDFDLELNFDYNQTQKDFEVIIDALRLGTNCNSTSSTLSSSSSTTATTANDSCGQAAMMSESGVFHNLVVASLET